MKNAIDNLMDEHQLILKVLASLEALATRLQSGGTTTRQDIGDFACFFRDFADKCHHCKEEDQLFIAMNQFGFPKEFGPVAVMLAEHTTGRAHVQALLKISKGSGPMSADETGLVINHATEFVALLSAHISKEDNILYPMAQNAIPPTALSKLDVDCEAFERQIMAPGEVEKLHELAARLIAAYPADLRQFASKSVCFGCH